MAWHTRYLPLPRPASDFPNVSDSRAAGGGGSVEGVEVVVVGVVGVWRWGGAGIGPA